MVSKKVLKKIGVFAMTAMLAAAPVMAVSASADVQLRAASTTNTNTNTSTNTNPTPSVDESTSKTTTSTVAAPSTNVVVTDAGLKLVSTVPGTYRVTVVDGVAVTTPAKSVPARLSLVCTNSMHGEAAEVSINDGLAILAANKVSAVKGPVIDILGYINKKKATDIETPITVVMGVPDSFRQAGYDYAIMLVQEGGRVSILTDKEADPSIVSVDTKGFGVYVLVKAPAGSFDKFN